jgi:hypothetical protein
MGSVPSTPRGAEVAATLELAPGEGARIVLGETKDHVYPITASLLVRSSWVAKAAAVPAEEGPAAGTRDGRRAGRRRGPVRAPANDTRAPTLTFPHQGSRSPRRSSTTSRWRRRDRRSGERAFMRLPGRSRLPGARYRYVARRRPPHRPRTCADAPRERRSPTRCRGLHQRRLRGPLLRGGRRMRRRLVRFPDSQAEAVATLTSGTTYYIVVWQFGTDPPGPGRPRSGPDHPSLAGPQQRHLLGAEGSRARYACHGDDRRGRRRLRAVGLGLLHGRGPDGLDGVRARGRYSFSARPRAAIPSARRTSSPGEPLSSPFLRRAARRRPRARPSQSGSCLAAANRGGGGGAFAADEVMCVQLAAGQLVYVYVVENAATITGGSPGSRRTAALSRPSRTMHPHWRMRSRAGRKGRSPGQRGTSSRLGAPAANARISSSPTASPEARPTTTCASRRRPTR